MAPDPNETLLGGIAAGVALGMAAVCVHLLGSRPAARSVILAVGLALLAAASAVSALRDLAYPFRYESMSIVSVRSPANETVEARQEAVRVRARHHNRIRERLTGLRWHLAWGGGVVVTLAALLLASSGHLRRER